MILHDILPKRFTKGDGREYIAFSRYNSEFNTGDDQIEYIVETSQVLENMGFPKGAELVSGSKDRSRWRNGTSCLQKYFCTTHRW